jgi:hypothetical protein
MTKVMEFVNSKQNTSLTDVEKSLWNLLNASSLFSQSLFKIT